LCCAFILEMTVTAVNNVNVDKVVGEVAVEAQTR